MVSATSVRERVHCVLEREREREIRGSKRRQKRIEKRGVRSEMRSDGGFVKQERHFCAEASKLIEKEREIENENAEEFFVLLWYPCTFLVFHD